MQYYNTHSIATKFTDDQLLELLEQIPLDNIWYIPGGADVCPELYGEENNYSSWFDKQVDSRELKLVRRLIELEAPILGVCRGHQLITIAEGGTLYQDIWMENITTDHSHGPVRVNPESILAEIFPYGNYNRIEDTIIANSLHHQATKDLPEGWEVSAWAKDGVVEAIENPDKPNIISVQWHPEFSTQFYDMLEYLTQFIKEGAE
jgi:putative glutamine amidotransferase